MFLLLPKQRIHLLWKVRPWFWSLQSCHSQVSVTEATIGFTRDAIVAAAVIHPYAMPTAIIGGDLWAVVIK